MASARRTSVAVDAGAGPHGLLDLSALEESLAGELRDRSRFSWSAPPVAGQVHLVVVIDDGRVTGDERTPTTPVSTV